MREVAAYYGSVEILVNNAGIGGVSKPVHEITEAEWDRVMAVNVKGVFFCTKHAVPHMLKARKGSIINISSIYGIVGAVDAPPYHASKGAVRLMTKTDALYYAKHGIRVNSIHPGFILTKMVEDSMRAAGDYEQNIAGLTALHPIGFLGDPDDIAHGMRLSGFRRVPLGHRQRIRHRRRLHRPLTNLQVRPGMAASAAREDAQAALSRNHRRRLSSPLPDLIRDHGG